MLRYTWKRITIAGADIFSIGFFFNEGREIEFLISVSL